MKPIVSRTAQLVIQPRVVSALAQLVGIAAITAGCALIAPWLGLIVAGLLLLVLGVAVDPPQRAQRAATYEGP